ncbi:MAG: SpoIIE family protein phosphatase [Candidatus Lambdaproteobacteria bacterium]|nr:SpoIIE family protein phosphatase [Candidatus Lambdaproteobacteria bacterium]
MAADSLHDFDVIRGNGAEREPPTLLVADDDPDILRIVQFYLQKQHFNVLVALDGEEALAILADQPNVELILSDVMMPKVSGLELLQQIRDTPSLRDIPVILISAEGESSKKVAGLNLGADDYITKPFNFDELMARVRNHLRLRRLQRELRVANDLLSRKNEQMLSDLEAARGVQMALLPSELPRNEAVAIGTRYVPMERVGGDFFDVVELEQGAKLGVLVADVCGHGIAAAFITAMTKISFRNSCFKSTDPAWVLDEMNRALNTNLTSGFVTAFYGVLDLRTRRLAYASGGHPPLLVHRRASDEILHLESQATFLGVFENVSFSSNVFDLQRGDRVLFYTDGIYEGQNPQQEQFGMERVVDAIKSNRGESMEVLLGDLLTRFQGFQHESTPEDDITIVGLDILA